MTNIDDPAVKNEDKKESINTNETELSEKDLLLNILIKIYNNDEDIYLTENDSRVSHIKNIKQLLNQLNREGYFTFCQVDVLGGIEIELSDKAINKPDNNKSTEPDSNVTNVYFFGDVRESNFSTGDNANQQLLNQQSPTEEKKSSFEKYLFPIILAVISAAAVIIAAIIASKQ